MAHDSKPIARQEQAFKTLPFLVNAVFASGKILRTAGATRGHHFGQVNWHNRYKFKSFNRYFVRSFLSILGRVSQICFGRNAKNDISSNFSRINCEVV